MGEPSEVDAMAYKVSLTETPSATPTMSSAYTTIVDPPQELLVLGSVIWRLLSVLRASRYRMYGHARLFISCRNSATFLGPLWQILRSLARREHVSEPYIPHLT